MDKYSDQAKARFGDKDIQSVIGKLLRWGVIISSSIVFAGGITFLIRHGLLKADYSVFKSEPIAYRNIGRILHGVLDWKGRDIIQLGLIVLIATPTARLIFSLGSFIIEKDLTYVIITLIVLAVITYSMLSGIAG